MEDDNQINSQQDSAQPISVVASNPESPPVAKSRSPVLKFGLVIIVIIGIAAVYVFFLSGKQTNLLNGNGNLHSNSISIPSTLASTSITTITSISSKATTSITAVQPNQPRNPPGSINGFGSYLLDDAYSPASYGMPTNEIYTYMIFFETNQLENYSASQGEKESYFVAVPGNMSYISYAEYASPGPNSILAITVLTFENGASSTFDMMTNFTGLGSTATLMNKTIIHNLPGGLRAVSFLIRNTSACTVPAPSICPEVFIVSENNSYIAMASYRQNNGTQINLGSQILMTIERTLMNLTK